MRDDSSIKGTPTNEQFQAYQAMYDFFNKELFDSKLPSIFLNFSRKAKTLGFFAPNRWRTAEKVTHEISLNPGHLEDRPEEVASTLVHEMVHLWQQEFGEPGRRAYHNKEWADRMQELGLVPSDTAKPGGSRVGQKVSHYIAENGRFIAAFKKMPAEYLLPWRSVREVATAPAGGATSSGGSRNLVKYSCERRCANVWGKARLSLVCGLCGSPFTAQTGS